jgi:hypothetical protein
VAEAFASRAAVVGGVEQAGLIGGDEQAAREPALETLDRASISVDLATRAAASSPPLETSSTQDRSELDF